MQCDIVILSNVFSVSKKTGVTSVRCSQLRIKKSRGYGNEDFHLDKRKDNKSSNLQSKVYKNN